MTNNRRSRPAELSDAVAPVRRSHHELIDAAVAWHAGRGHQLDPDHAALVCAGVEHAAGPDVTTTCWTRTGVYSLVRCDILNWCSAQRCLWPEELPQVLWAWIDFLHATGRLDPGSDPVAELRKPLACYGWLDQDGKPLPSDAPRVIECECFLPYRETAQLLGELAQLTERSGEDPLDPLRRVVGRPTERRSGWSEMFPDDDEDPRWWSPAGEG